jgi:hypothetical protein
VNGWSWTGYSGRRVGHPLDWVAQTADERLRQNDAFVHVVQAGFADADAGLDDVQLEELTWPLWENGRE